MNPASRAAPAHRSGHTLVELAFVLMLGALLLTLATPPFLQARDALAVRAARDHLVQSVALARALAPLHGGAEVVLDSVAARVTVQSRARIHESVSLAERYGARLALDGSARSAVELRYDALGIGRLANRTVTLLRGDARAGVTISSYGRARPW